MTNKYKKISFLVVALFLISSCDNAGSAGSAGIDLTDVKDNQEKILKKLDAIEKSQLGIKSAIAGISKPAPNNKKQQPQADPNKVYDIAIGDSYTIGNKNAPITIIEWTDFQ
jgi:protein-disulfide isomerase